MPLQGTSFSSSVLESIIISYKNYKLDQDQAISGHPFLARILSSNQALSDLIKMEIDALQSEDIEVSEAIRKGVDNAINLLLETIIQIDYLGDGEVFKVQSLYEFLFNYSNLSDDHLISLHLKFKDFTTGLAEIVNIYIHKKMIARRKEDPFFDIGLQAIDRLLPENWKFYATSFGLLPQGENPSIARYSAELFTVEDADLKELLESTLSNEIPTLILGTLFEKCINGSEEEFFAIPLNLSKKVQDEFYLGVIRSTTSPDILTRLLRLTCYHGKFPIAEEILSIKPALPADTLIRGFVEASAGGQIHILELFLNMFPDLHRSIAINKALLASVSANTEAVTDFFISQEFFSFVPITGEYSIFNAAILAIKRRHYTIFEKLMTSPQFEEILLNEILNTELLDSLAEDCQLSLMQRIISSDQFRRSLLEPVRLYYEKYLSSITGVFLFGCYRSWNPLIQKIMASPEFEGIRAIIDPDLGLGLAIACYNGNDFIVSSLLAHNNFTKIPAEEGYSISWAFLVAASNRQQAVAITFLESSRAQEIHLDGTCSISKAFEKSIKQGLLPLFLKIISLPRYADRLTPEQNALLTEDHGKIKLALQMALQARSEPLLQAIIESDQYIDIPATGPLSLTTSLKQALTHRLIPVASAILKSQRNEEIPPLVINQIWNEAININLLELNVAIMESPIRRHIPLEGKNGIRQTLTRAKKEGNLPLFLATHLDERTLSFYSNREEYFLSFPLHLSTGALSFKVLSLGLHSSASNGNLALIQAIFQSELFGSIPSTESTFNLNSAFNEALIKKDIPILQAFLNCTRNEELFRVRRQQASNLILFESRAPKNIVLRFFWRFFTPKDPHTDE